MILNPVIAGGGGVEFPVAISTGETITLGSDMSYLVANVLVDGVYYGTGYDTNNSKYYDQYKILYLPQGKEIELMVFIGGNQTTNKKVGIYVDGVRKDNNAVGTTKLPFIIKGPTVIRLTGENGTLHTRFGRIDVWEEQN